MRAASSRPAPSTSSVPRCRQRLWNTRSAPASSRYTKRHAKSVYNDAEHRPARQGESCPTRDVETSGEPGSETNRPLDRAARGAG